MITGPMIISYPHIFEAAENPSGALKFSCSLLIDKGDTKTVESLKAAIDKAIARGKEKIWDGKLPKFRYEPLRDGDKELADGDKTDAIYKNKFFLNCSSNNAPGVVGPDAKPLMDHTKLYAGCIVRADINPFPYSSSGNKGVGWGLNNLMLVSDGERLDGKQNAEDAFADHATTEDDGLA